VHIPTVKLLSLGESWEYNDHFPSAKVIESLFDVTGESLEMLELRIVFPSTHREGLHQIYSKHNSEKCWKQFFEALARQSSLKKLGLVVAIKEPALHLWSWYQPISVATEAQMKAGFCKEFEGVREIVGSWVGALESKGIVVEFGLEWVRSKM